MRLRFGPLEALKEKNKDASGLIQEGRNQVLYLLLAIGDENVAHDNYHPDRAHFLLEVRREIVKRLKSGRETFPPDAGLEWPDFEKYTYCPG